ncbi:MAG: AEC family transporter [Epulopiscium sp.]|nr:AEC family transporter [Candidatus Epulonipiscium sp.]
MILNQIFILFLLMIVGYIARKANVFSSSDSKGLSSLLIKVTMPAMIIHSMQKPFDPQLFRESLQVLFFSCIVYTVSFFIAKLFVILFRPQEKDQGVFQFMIVFSNVVFMGYPVLQAIFGEESLFYGAIYNLPFNLLVFTLGIYFIQGKRKNTEQQLQQEKWKLLLHPAIIAVGIGFTIFLFSISLPGPIQDTLGLLGGLTTPLSMIIVGGLLAETDIKQIFGNWRLYILCTIRLIIFPMITWGILQFFTKDLLMLGIPVIISAMPVAANAAIIATEYDGNEALASQGIFLSTLLSIGTIPLMAYLLSLFYQ